MEVEVLVPAAERRGVARVVEQPRYLAAQVLPVGAPGEHRLSQFRLFRHEILRLLRVRVLQPAIGIGNLNAVVVVDDGIVAAGRRVREAGGVASYRAHGDAWEEREAAGARRPREEEGFERTA